MDEVDDEALDVRAVVILIGHDHDLAVSEILDIVRVFVLFRVVQPDDFAQVGNFGVVHDLSTAEYRWEKLPSRFGLVRNVIPAIRCIIIRLVSHKNKTRQRTCLCDASRTLSSLPLRGNTP